MKHPSTIYLLLTVILTLGLTARGQRPAFGVYLTAGAIKCIPAHGGGSTPVLQHDWLYEGDKLILLDNIAEITLFDHDSSYILLHGKGAYTTAEIEKMQPTRVRDTTVIRYLSLLWAEIQPAASARGTAIHASGGTPGLPTPIHTSGLPTNTSGPQPHTGAPSLTRVLAPRDSYATSMDSLIFRWRQVYWARKYFLRLRSPDGQLRYDSVLIDTQAVVHFPGRMPVGNSYYWTLDIVGESGRLQFADSNHIVLIDESAVLPTLPPITEDSIGGIAILLQRIEQYENAGCIKQAETLFEQLTNDSPQDNALDKLYFAFRQRNYF
jgi:hypothetical protein